MADSRRIVLSQPLELEQILQEAQHRWLRAHEICEILSNYKKFQLTSNPPVRPPAGSLFLFDRKVLRYFRKDGHRWRKKRDGKTVKEAHEKLKAGSVDVLHCYYAHGEDNENFQRRSYWMLDEQSSNIVLVHYREVKEVWKLGVPHSLNAGSEPQLQSQTNSSTFLEQTHSPDTTIQTSYASYPNSVDWNGQPLSSEFEDGDSGEDAGISSLLQSVQHSLPDYPSFHTAKTSGFCGASSSCGTSSSIWPNNQGSRNANLLLEQKLDFDHVKSAEFLSHKLVDARLDADSTSQDVARSDDWLTPNSQTNQLNKHSGSQARVTVTAKAENGAHLGGATNNEAGELKKLDSFGRWMDKEIGGDCDDYFMTSVSGKYWNTLDTENGDKEVSSLSRHMQLDTDSLGPSLSQEQLYSINDFAPDWANSGVVTKILITGTFLGDKEHFSRYKWCCMFGEIEVPAEVLNENVIRCQVPFHAPGCVPFYITCSNRLACSEVREFEFRESSSGLSLSMNVKSARQDELGYLMRLAKMLSSGLEKKWLYCSVVNCDKCEVKNTMYSLKSDNENSWGRVEAHMALGENSVDVLTQNLLKDKLYEWLACKTHEVGKGLHILDEEGQGVIHLVAALGYEWAMGPIVAAGVGPNFRDARGKTALHWASFYGREETVIELLRLGAAAGAVDDPTPAFPGGQTAADLASIRGQKGIAGYLAEADLTSHLSSLSFKGSVIDSAGPEIEEEKAIENAAQFGFPLDEASDITLKGSLAAVRKSARAAALIQDAFRVLSFRRRQMTESSNDISEVPADLVTLGCLSKVQKMNNFEDYLHSAAVKIQQKYRGWKDRKEFLKIRKRIVRIQAHVRGHQVRKLYKKIVWSVSVVEKAILRWRRKKPGLRGFWMQKTIENQGPEVNNNDEYDFLRIGRKQKNAGVKKALARVESMARHPDARDQYMRLVAKFEDFKVRDRGSNALEQVNRSEKSEVDAPGT